MEVKFEFTYILRTLSLRRRFLAAQRGSDGDAEVDKFMRVGEIRKKRITHVAHLRGNIAIGSIGLGFVSEMEREESED